jgi:hypothetical protein
VAKEFVECLAITANPGVFRRREKLLISRMREREREA